MSIKLSEAYAKAETISLHCTEGVRDALYDMQLLPVETAAGIRWSVHAQYGRKGNSLNSICKCEEKGFHEAQAFYEKILTDKRGKHYRTVTTTRKSDISAVTAKVAKESTATLPVWPGFSDFYSEVTAHVNAKLGASASKSIPTLVALADVAYGSAEGLPDAIERVQNASSVAAIAALLSAETKAWFPTGTELATVTELSSLCARL